GMGGRDAQSVAALLGLRAVRVEYTNRHRRRVERQQPVGAETPMAVAKKRQQRHQIVKRAGQLEYEVVVAQRLVLNEIDSHYRDYHPESVRASAGCHKMSCLCGTSSGLPSVWFTTRP